MKPGEDVGVPMENWKDRMQSFEATDATEYSHDGWQCTGLKPAKKRQRITSTRTLLDSGRNHVTPSLFGADDRQNALDTAPFTCHWQDSFLLMQT